MPFRSVIKYRVIFRVLSFLLIFESLFLSTGIFVAWYYNETLTPFIYSVAVTLGLGLISWYVFGRDTKKGIGKREGYLIVSLSWILMSLFGALPYLFSGAIPSFTDAFFETISGFTTTGASILSEIEILPKSILYWRAMTHWIGGMGIIVLTVAILPFLGIGGMQLLVAEMPGITPDRLHPRITATAKRLWGIYVIFTIAEVLLLWAGEMDFFDSVCHSFATMATGGFSTKNDSISGFSAYSQYIIIVFMALAGINFTLHYLALHRKFSKIWANQEFKAYITIIVVISVIIGIGLIIFMHEGAEKAFRDSLFTVVSILTTTGFVTANYYIWPGYLWMLVFALMFLGGSAGSTGGGIKIVRHLLLIKNSWLELKRAIHPNAIIPVKFNGKAVSQNIIFNVMAFFIIYVLIFASGTIALSVMGYDFETSIGATIASLGNIGPGIGGVGPVENYGFFTPVAKWLLSFLMLLGRLELFTILIVLSPAFWKQ
ncbi:MAG: potassium transporter [Marinilabiliales bacterium]|nr:MAG: potassium transporter [Marinilabiliales bacterium]